MLSVSNVALCLWMFSTLLSISSSVYVWMWLRKAPSRNNNQLPPVSILKPLKGVDPGLAESLETFLTQDYPNYEVIFAVAEAEDPAIAVVTKLLARYPNAQARLVVGDEQVGANPKVNNLVRPLTMARYDYVVISDSNIRATPTYLRDLVRETGANIGAVTAPIRGLGGEGIGGRLEEMHLNSFYIRSMLVSHALGTGLVLGKTMMFKRSFSDRLGGFNRFGNQGAEDYAFGMATRRVGREIALVSAPVTQHVGARSFQNFFLRHSRWSTLRKYSAPGLFFIEWAHHGILTLLFAWVGWSQLGTAYSVASVVATALIWILGDLALSRQLGGRFNLGIWALRELTVPLIWLSAVVTRQVTWRGNKLRLLSGGRVQTAQEQTEAKPDWLSAG